MTAADRLKKVRGSLSKSQKEMAVLLGMNYRTYENYEKALSDPSWSTCEALVKLGFSVNWLLTGEGEMKLAGAGGQAAVAEKAVAEANIAGRSPIKTAAVSYIDAMADGQVAEVIKFLVPKEKAWMSADDIALQNMSPEGKARVRAAIEAQIKEIEDATASDSIELRPTGT